MALETLKGVEEIGGFKVNPTNNIVFIDMPIAMDFINNTITFRLQSGPIKENGVNGCQVDTLIHTAMIIIAELNCKYPCKENRDAIGHLASAILSLEDRTKDREARGVEGTSNE